MVWITATNAYTQTVMRLWEGDAPGALGNNPEDVPTLSWYKVEAEKKTGAAVIVCPGGGYVTHAWEQEGVAYARYLNSMGIDALVLKYRLNTWDDRKYRYPAQWHDITRAIRIVRSNAKNWGLDPFKIGVMGSSAGGHLISMASVHYDNGDTLNADPVEHVASRPDFAIYVYPVITLIEPDLHTFSRRMILGNSLNRELAAKLSAEQQCDSFTPPSFFVCFGSDHGVPPQNSLRLYQALRKNNVPAEIHIFEGGDHGIGLAEKDPLYSIWPELLKRWLVSRGVIPMQQLR